MALQRRLVKLAQLRAYAEAHPRTWGVAHLRRVLDLAEPASESAMETRLRLVLVLAGLPRPQVQVPLYDERGRFLGRPDLHYPEQRLGLEYDGATHRSSLAEDNRRQNRLQDAGYRLLRFTSVDVNRTPEEVVALVARQLR
jgi:very-short-patch-repair endonuclease